VQTEIIQLTQLVARKQACFGEFLVQEQVLDRFQLLRALQFQDRSPSARLGQCAVALGFAPADAIERLHQRYVHRLDPEAAATAAWLREEDIELVSD
jgi:hypothetical protein